jgi:hypothetical protein
VFYSHYYKKFEYNTTPLFYFYEDDLKISLFRTNNGYRLVLLISFLIQSVGVSTGQITAHGAQRKVQVVVYLTGCRLISNKTSHSNIIPIIICVSTDIGYCTLTAVARMISSVKLTPLPSNVLL